MGLTGADSRMTAEARGLVRGSRESLVAGGAPLEMRVCCLGISMDVLSSQAAKRSREAGHSAGVTEQRRGGKVPLKRLGEISSFNGGVQCFGQSRTNPLHLLAPQQGSL